MIHIQHLTAFYGSTTPLHNLCLELETGGSYVLIGPSGCGKSTLIKILCGIHQHFSGSIECYGKPYFSQKPHIGYVPQTYGLLNWKTVLANIYLPQALNACSKPDEAEAMAVLHMLELHTLTKKFPLQLSGGQQQRVALARAFLARPDVLLMDEPFSSLDAFTSANSQQLFLRLWQKYRTTSLIITHNVDEAVTLGQHILMMDKSSGCIARQIENPSFLQQDRHLHATTREKVLHELEGML